MTKYKILLKKHWKKKELRPERTERKRGPSDDPEPPDLGDLEVETSTRSLYSRTVRFTPPPGDPEVRDRIRMYRVISSVLVYGMIFSMLCFSSNFVNTTLKEVDAKKKKEHDMKTAVVTRKMRTNYTQDEEMSRLSYDAFVQKVEEEIKNKKRMRIVPVHQKGQKNSTAGNSTLASRKEIGLKAFQKRFSTPSSVELKVKGKTEVASTGEMGKKDTQTLSKQTVLLESSPMQRDASDGSAGNHVNTGPAYPQQTRNTQPRQPGGSPMYLSPTNSNMAAAGSSGLPSAGAISQQQQQQQTGLSTTSLANNQLMPQQPLVFPGTSTNMMNQQQAGAALPLQTYSLQTTTPQLSNVPNTLSRGNQFPSYEAFIAQLQNNIGNPMPQIPVYVPQNSPFLAQGAMASQQQLPQSHP